MPRCRSILIAAPMALLAASALAQPATEPPVSAAVAVEAVGHAAADHPDARRTALEDALRHAVEAGAGVHVASESVTDHARLTRDVVTVTSAGRVRSYRVTDETPDDAGRYVVRLRAQVVPDACGPPLITRDADATAPVHRIRVVVEGQLRGAAHAAYAAQRLRERGLHALSPADPARDTDATLVLHVTQHCVAAPDAYGVPLMRADVSVTATLAPAGPPPNPAGPRTGATATRHAFGTTAAAAAGRAHQRALDAAIDTAFERGLNAGGNELFASPRNP